MKPKLDAKEKGFYGIMIIGAAAGLLEGTLAHGFSLRYVFPGAVLTLCAAFLGGFGGFLSKDLMRISRGLKPYRGVNNDGMMLGSFMGTLLGTLAQIAGSANGANILIGSMVGSAMGAWLGAMSDDFVSPMLALLESPTSSSAKKKMEGECSR
ncbi:hypothetical protein [Pseudodesulfovibrio senegalensis]|uniref:Uncharacterized protein n=1 Tax=Pseudodesulfovibrio senegalensis TaxID=1721087 RepID=A0A6N6N6R9_9BACT|nr:hypothetical protein [Pseudodesulfovibrio senegalensis]KAB1443428.1 hypothetical protein F8A88_04020 [Pseudodesulfovibrio senegalensis]